MNPQNKRSNDTDLESLLRAAAPQLRPPHRERVTAACERAAAGPPPAAFRAPRLAVRALLRVAACAVLLLGLAPLLRTRPVTPQRAPPPAATPAPVAAMPALSDLSVLMPSYSLGAALASEADGLTDDLTGLTDAINSRALAILF